MGRYIRNSCQYKNPSSTRTPRNLYLAEKAGEPTRYNVMREDIDAAINQAFTTRHVSDYLKKLGYIINFSESHNSIKNGGTALTKRYMNSGNPR